MARRAISNLSILYCNKNIRLVIFVSYKNNNCLQQREKRFEYVDY